MPSFCSMTRQSGLLPLARNLGLLGQPYNDWWKFPTMSSPSPPVVFIVRPVGHPCRALLSMPGVGSSLSVSPLLVLLTGPCLCITTSVLADLRFTIVTKCGFSEVYLGVMCVVTVAPLGRSVFPSHAMHQLRQVLHAKRPLPMARSLLISLNGRFN